MDFLCLIVHLITCIEIRGWQAYARTLFSRFTSKFQFEHFLEARIVILPRFNLELAHPQHATHCLMRLRQPRVPITNGRAIRIPQCWTDRSLDLQLHSDEELGSLNEFALYVISRYYPLISLISM